MGCKSITEKPKPKPKQKHRKGLWSPEEDQRLRDYVLKYGHGCWSSVPINAGLQRNGKSCRLRWINYLRPGLKRGMFTAQEEDTILRLHHVLGNKWSQIAQHLAGRTDNEIKNYWHSYLKKKLAKTEPLDHQIKTESNSHSTESPLSQELPTTQNLEFSASQISSQTSFLPKIIFAEWLTPGGDTNSCSAGSFSGFEHQPLFDAGTISDHSDGLPDSLVQSVLLSGDAGFEGRSGSLEDIISYGSCYSNDVYAKMEDQILESEFLGFVSRNGICSSSEYDMHSGLMYI